MRRDNQSIIRQHRAKLALTQEALGELMNVSANTIRSWENNFTQPNVHQIVMLSVYLDVTLDELMSVYNNKEEE